MKRYLILILSFCFLVSPSQAQRNKKSATLPADSIPGASRIVEVLNLVQSNYVESANTDKLGESAIRAILSELDPHSIYVPAKDVERTNESLQGNFEGVGVTISITSDTIIVGDVVAGGPAEKVGVLRGDKILRIDGENATGDSVNNAFVFKRLRGKKGTLVTIDMLRDLDTITFVIERDKIPIYSIDSYFMVDDTIGYIRLLRFARTSVKEFRNALHSLEKEGMKSLILDLRGNTGGYLDIAFGLANEFISSGRLLVYQEGRMQPRQDFKSKIYGSFREGNLVVMVDENSASASEIVSGAVQDWDRGILVGRRTFGKGLVQRMYTLADGGQVRLTTARYYTPSGRCIQKPYSKGSVDYRSDLNRRFKHGEYVSADSIHFPDSLKYTTAGGRTVYGGGGIMPDIFVPMDTMRLTDYYLAVSSKGILRQFPQQWASQHRHDERVKDFDAFMANYDQLGIDPLMEHYAAEKGVERDTAKENADTLRTRHSDKFLHYQLKALVAQNLFGLKYYYLIMKDIDDCYQVAVGQIRKPSTLPRASSKKR